MRPTVARFAVTGQKLPHLTDTIILAERVHAALVSLSDGSTVFSGCDEQGKPLDGHGHAHIFCESNLESGKSNGGKITHITIYASTRCPRSPHLFRVGRNWAVPCDSYINH